MRATTLLSSLLVAAAVGYCGYSQYEDRVRATAERERNQLEVAEMMGSLEAMADRHGASARWPNTLAGTKGRRTSPVMSAELQQVWVTNKPVLFVGALKDIVQQDGGNYEVLLEYPEFGLNESFPETGIQLRVVCSPEQTAPLLSLAKSRRRLSTFADVALVAKVSGISSQVGRGSDSEPELRLIGKGACIDSLVLRRRVPRDWLASLRTR